MRGIFSSLGFHARDLAADPPDLTLQVADAGFVGVFADDPAEGIRLKHDVEFIHAIFVHLARDQIAVGDLEFFFLDVAGELDHFHAVQQRGRECVPEYSPWSRT